LGSHGRLESFLVIFFIVFVWTGFVIAVERIGLDARRCWLRRRGRC
jgi:hypothetical protein